MLGNLKHPDLVPAGFNFEDTLTHVTGEEKQKFINFVCRMMKWKPEERSTAKDLLNDPYLRPG
jgi:serine/threonine-protein kinase SRPK3